MFEVVLYELTNVLGVGEIKSSIDLVENVNWRRFKQQKSQN